MMICCHSLPLEIFSITLRERREEDISSVLSPVWYVSNKINPDKRNPLSHCIVT